MGHGNTHNYRQSQNTTTTFYRSTFIFASWPKLWNCLIAISCCNFKHKRRKQKTKHCYCCVIKTDLKYCCIYIQLLHDALSLTSTLFFWMPLLRLSIGVHLNVRVACINFLPSTICSLCFFVPLHVLSHCVFLQGSLDSELHAPGLQIQALWAQCLSFPCSLLFYLHF